MFDLNIDYLKKNNSRIYYFGLGFVQLVLNKQERIHFYNENINPTNEEVHNHRYNFNSKILKGCLTDIRYKLISGDKYILINESCNKDKKLDNDIKIEVGLEVCSVSEYYTGDSYDIFFNEFHNVNYFGNTITHLTRSDIILDYAQVLYGKGKEIVCPFEKQYSENELWQIVEDTINN